MSLSLPDSIQTEIPTRQFISYVHDNCPPSPPPRGRQNVEVRVSELAEDILVCFLCHEIETVELGPLLPLHYGENARMHPLHERCINELHDWEYESCPVCRASLTEPAPITQITPITPTTPLSPLQSLFKLICCCE